MGLSYVDIFYHHRPDAETPLEETAGALAQAVRTGKALYAGISNYPADLAARMVAIMRDLGAPCLIHQPKYNMLVREPESGLFNVLSSQGIGCIAFSPLAQGLLTDKYLSGIPAGSRAARNRRFLRPEQITPELLNKARSLNDIARARGQSLSQMALAWVLRQPAVTSALIGASSPGQVQENVAACNGINFSSAELDQIDGILASKQP